MLPAASTGKNGTIACNGVQEGLVDLSTVCEERLRRLLFCRFFIASLCIWVFILLVTLAILPVNHAHASTPARVLENADSHSLGANRLLSGALACGNSFE